jgi:hypothetical protein
MDRLGISKGFSAATLALNTCTVHFVEIYNAIPLRKLGE